MQEGLRPPPPPCKYKVEKTDTFSISVQNGEIHIPDWYMEVWGSIREYVVHEFNHGRICGIPYTYLESKRLQAAIMAGLEVDQGTSAGLLNTVGDIVNDVYTHGKVFQGHTFDMRNAQETWLKRFPVKQGDQVNSYYILNLLYQRFVGGNILNDPDITSTSSFKQLAKDVGKLIEQAHTNPETKDTELVVEASQLLYGLSDHNVDEHTCMQSQPATGSDLQQVAQYAVEFGLTASQLQDLAENPQLTESDAEKLLYKARRLRAAESVYKSQVGFKNFIGGAGEAICAPSTRGFRPSDKDVSIESVALYPHDPRRWRTPTKYVLTTIPTRYEKELGFKKIIAIIDRSGSTKLPFKGRPIITHEWDCLASLVGFATDQKIKLDAYAFDDTLVAVKGATPMQVLVNAMEYGPDGNTELELPIRAVWNETGCLIVIITDGEVDGKDVRLIGHLVKTNKVIAMEINEGYKDAPLVRTPIKGFTLYASNPASGQRVIFSELKGSLGL